MKNKFPKISATLIFATVFSFCGYSQDANMPAKLVYTIHVDGLVNQEQATRLDNSFKQKVGILSDDVNFESKTIIVKTTEEVTYINVCDILLTEGVKGQTYVVNKE
jgi:hypothetical protein